MNKEVKAAFLQLNIDIGNLPNAEDREKLGMDYINVLQALIDQAKHEKAVLSGEDIQ